MINIPLIFGIVMVIDSLFMFLVVVAWAIDLRYISPQSKSKSKTEFSEFDHVMASKITVAEIERESKNKKTNSG